MYLPIEVECSMVAETWDGRSLELEVKALVDGDEDCCAIDIQKVDAYEADASIPLPLTYSDLAGLVEGLLVEGLADRLQDRVADCFVNFVEEAREDSLRGGLDDL